MTAKEYLARAYNLEKEIRAQMEEACHIRSMAERATGVFTAIRTSGTGSRSKVEDAVVRLDSLERDIVADIERLVRVKEEIRAAIAKLGKPEHRALLRLLYLCCKKWEEIAATLNYSWRSVHYKHSEALKAFAKVCTQLHNGK